MSPQRKNVIHEWAATAVAILVLLTSAVGALTTYVKTCEKVDGLVEDRKEQISTNRDVANRLAAIESALSTRSARAGNWADRDHGQ